MDGENHGKPLLKMDDLGGKTHYFRKHPNKRIATRGSSLQSCWIPTPNLEGWRRPMLPTVPSRRRWRPTQDPPRPPSTWNEGGEVATAWWLDHPSDNCESKWVKNLPQFSGVNMKSNISNHQLGKDGRIGSNFDIWGQNLVKHGEGFCHWFQIPSWQWEMNLLKMYDMLKMRIFHCYVSLLESIAFWNFLELKQNTPFEYFWILEVFPNRIGFPKIGLNFEIVDLFTGLRGSLRRGGDSVLLRVPKCIPSLKLTWYPTHLFLVGMALKPGRRAILPYCL